FHDRRISAADYGLEISVDDDVRWQGRPQIAIHLPPRAVVIGIRILTEKRYRRMAIRPEQHQRVAEHMNRSRAHVLSLEDLEVLINGSVGSPQGAEQRRV